VAALDASPMSESNETRFNFHGALPVPGHPPSEFTATVSFPRWDPTVLSVQLLWIGSDEQRARGAAALGHLGQNYVWLESLDPIQGPVELLGIDQVSTTSNGSYVHCSTVRVQAVQVGITDNAWEARRDVQFTARLQPSGILKWPTLHEQSFTGEISLRRVEDGAVRLQLDNTSIEGATTYEYDGAIENGNKVTKQVQRATLMGMARTEPGQSLYGLHEKLKSDLADVCTALSLCYRQPVDYYELEYRLTDSVGPAWIRQYRRRWTSIKTRLRGDELIYIGALTDGGLQRLASSIQQFHRAADLRRAITFLSGSYAASPETAFFMAFSAMETIVACCLNDDNGYVVGSSAWDRIRHELQRTINGLAGTDENIRRSLGEKLPELRRVTLARRLKVACERFSPRVDDLWIDISFDEGVRRATNIRNGLFHAANSKVEDTVGGDLIRIRTFTERLLLKLLSWPDGSIWTWYDQNLRWANQG
jgi:hypothetical protein